MRNKCILESYTPTTQKYISTARVYFLKTKAERSNMRMSSLAVMINFNRLMTTRTHHDSSFAGGELLQQYMSSKYISYGR